MQIQGLLEKEAIETEEMHSIINYGNKARTTHSTKANSVSSRSHAICQIRVIGDEGQEGKLVLCDLAGSERAQDCQSNSKQRRMEGANINKSLLALKECIRAMHSKSNHVPFRASKLTLALRDSFIAEKNNTKIVMIACICPGSNSSDHTINTLRYADRLKMKQNRDIDPNKAIYLDEETGEVKEKKSKISRKSDRVKIDDVNDDGFIGKFPGKKDLGRNNSMKKIKSNDISKLKYGEKMASKNKIDQVKKITQISKTKTPEEISKNSKPSTTKSSNRGGKNLKNRSSPTYKNIASKKVNSSYQRALDDSKKEKQTSPNSKPSNKIPIKKKSKIGSPSYTRNTKPKITDIKALKKEIINSPSYNQKNLSNSKKNIKDPEIVKENKFKNKRLEYKKNLVNNHKIEDLDKEELKRSQYQETERKKKQKDYNVLKTSLKWEKGIFKNENEVIFDSNNNNNNKNGEVEEDSDDAMFNHQQKIDDLVDMHEEILTFHNKILQVKN